MSNARVSAAGLTGRTDARGQVTLPLTAVPTDVMVDAEGFLTATVHVTALRQTIEVSLEPLPEFKIRSSSTRLVRRHESRISHCGSKSSIARRSKKPS